MSNKVKQTRESLNISQRELAAMVGTGHATISNIETGSTPNVILALRIAKSLKTTVENLWGDCLMED